MSPLTAAPGVELYDTTLRDGAQREGISYTLEDKLRIAEKLDEFGVAFIEGGWPGSNPKDAAFFERAKTTRACAPCSTRARLPAPSSARPGRCT